MNRLLVSGAAIVLLGSLIGTTGAQTSAPGLERRSVREAQQALQRAGYEPGPIDGIIGPKMRAALTAYQQSQGLRATGELDSEMMARLGVRPRRYRPTPQHVRQVQQALTDVGLDPGPVDGRMGPHTKAALRRYAAPPTPSAASAIIEQFRRSYEGLQSP